MLNFIICEDNERERNKIDEYVTNIINKSKIQCEIALVTSDPHKVLDFSNNHLQDINVYMLDIDLKSDLNGLILAKQIRLNDINCYFIFITSHVELSMMTFQYKLKALDYIDKSDYAKLKDRLSECIAVIYEEYLKNVNENNDSNSIVTIKSAGRIFNIDAQEIIFLETIAGHKIQLHTAANIIECYSSIKELSSMLNESYFFRSHKSYIINIKHIKEINIKEKYILMNNGKKCLLSRQYSKELINKCSLM